MRIILLQLAATIAMATYAAFAALSGLDRLVDDDGGFTGVVGWAYARNAPYQAANAAAKNSHWDLAKSLMRRAIGNDPLNERMIGNLGLIRLEAGDSAGADAAFRVSALRGWRDPVTHAYWMNQSLAAGDFTSAAIQADALLHAPLTPRQSDAIINTLLEYDEGRTALAARLRAKPPWAHDFVVKILSTSDAGLAARADVIGRARTRLWTCLDTSGMIDRLAHAGLLQAALVVRNASCAAPGKFVNDGNFARYLAEGRTSVLDWRAPDDSNITVEPLGHSGIRISTSSGVTQTVLSQRIIAPVGTYHLTWKMPGTTPALVGKLLVGLACEPDLGKAVSGTLVPGTTDTYSAVFRLPQDCPLSVLNFWLKPTSEAIAIESVNIERLAS